MSSPLKALASYGVVPKRLVHVGANTGQEFSEYRDGGIVEAVFVEPLDPAFRVLSDRIKEVPGYVAVQAVCTERDGDVVPFFVASNDGESSSLLRPKLHTTAHPSVTFQKGAEMRSTRLDTLLAEAKAKHGQLSGNFDVLVLDVQGAEMKVFQGAPATLGRIDAIWCEVSHREMYEGNARFIDIVAFLDALDFKLLYFKANRKFYGDALFLKRPG